MRGREGGRERPRAREREIERVIEREGERDRERERERVRYRDKETYYSVIRDPGQCQKRPTTVSRDSAIQR